MKITFKDNLSVEGQVQVNEILPDGTKKIKRENENIVVGSGILLLMHYLMSDESSVGLSGVTHLGIGIGTPDNYNASDTDEVKRTFFYSLSDLKKEVVRVIRWDMKYLRKDEFGNLKFSKDPTNIVEFSYRLRQKEPEEKIYISEIGMYAGNVEITHVPTAETEYELTTNMVSSSQVVNKGILFSYKFYDPPIDKFPDTILEFLWRISFIRG